MPLTQTSRIQNDDSFPVIQLFLLALVRVAEPIALTSIFPYANRQVKSFGFEEKSAPFYAGIVVSAYALFEALSGFFWGSLSDRIGRKPVLLIGCSGTMMSMLIVGFSTNFWVALLGRVLGGLLNGNIGVIHSMVAELVKKPEHEAKAFTIMPFCWSIGTIIGPALGSFLVEPVQNFPSLFPEHGLFDHFPYLLPNLICTAFLTCSMLLGYFFLAETHPDLQPQADLFLYNEETDHTPLINAAGAIASPAVELRTESYGTFNEVNLHEEEHWVVNADGSSRPPSLNEKHRPKAFTWQVSMLLVALGIFIYHSMTYDHLLPIFLEDDRRDQTYSANGFGLFHVHGGLGLTTQAVGVMFIFDGLFALFIQAVVFPLIAEWLGIWSTFVLVTVLHPISYFIVPFLSLLPETALVPGIYTCLAVRNFLSIIAYPLILIQLKRATPSASVLGKINGMGASVGASCRTIAPPIAGLLYGIGTQIGFTGLAYWGSTLVALLGALQLLSLSQERDSSPTTVKSVAPCVAKVQPDLEPKEVVRLQVADV